MSNKNRLQCYFAEIIREYFDYGTPHHYRVNLSNPRTLLHELLDYCELLQGTVHLQHDHVKHIIDEYLYVMKKDIVYSYYKDICSDFHEFLKGVRNQKNDTDFNKNIYLLISRLKSIIIEVDNKYYIESRKLINDFLSKDETAIEPIDFVKLKKICFSFSTEILRRGYSKGYIYDRIMTLLIQDFQFEEFIDSFDRRNYEYEVYLKVNGATNEDITKIFSQEFGSENVSKVPFKFLEDICANDLGMNQEKASNLIRGFKKSHEGSLFIIFKENTIDYNNAVRISKRKLDNIFDKIYYEFSDKTLSIFHHGICVDLTEGTIKMPVVIPQLDGFKSKSSLEFFKTFDERVTKILASEIVNIETKNKIKTLLRFYRYFSDADTLEHKFINLWIGWEHVFSLNITKDGQTWKNIYSFFPFIHAINYPEDLMKDILNVQLKRNIKNEAQRNQLKLRLENLLSDDVAYQLSNLCIIIKDKQERWEKLLNLEILKEDDLTKVKLFRIQQKLRDPKLFVTHIKEKAEWDLFRMYRVRNAIVHKGNIDYLGLPLEGIVAQLEDFYIELLDTIISRLYVNDRFDSIEQLFLAYQRTFELMTSDDNLSKIDTGKDMKRKLMHRPLIY